VERYSQGAEHASVSRAARRSRAFRARLERRRRRWVLLATGAAIVLALGFEFAVASFGGISVAEAAVSQAKSLVDLLDQRSPGARTAGELTKTKGKRIALGDREWAPTAAVPKNLAAVLAPPTPEVASVDVGVPIAALGPIVPPPPGEILLPPPGGGVIVTPPGGGAVVPPGGGDTPPGGGDNPPPGPPNSPPPPAVPEPGTWMTMILGFGLVGWMLRRNRPALARV
jgi:hypothetical protein